MGGKSNSLGAAQFLAQTINGTIFKRSIGVKTRNLSVIFQMSVKLHGKIELEPFLQSFLEILLKWPQNEAYRPQLDPLISTF